MTDNNTFLQQLIVSTNNFILAFEQMKLMADRIRADSAAATNLAAAAQTRGRTDLIIANFDNLNNAMQLLETTMNNPNAGVNTGGAVELAFYQII